MRRSIPWAVLDSVGAAAIGAMTLVVLSRVLTPTEFGVVALAQSIALIVQTFASLGLGPAIVRSRPIDVRRDDTAFWAALCAGVIGFVICGAAALVLWTTSGSTTLLLVVAAEGASCLFVGASLVPTALLERKLRMEFLAKRTLLARGVFFAVAVGLAYGGAGLWSVIAAGFAQNLVGTAVLFAYWHRKPGLHFSWPNLRSLLSIGIPVMLEGALWSIQERVFLILVGAIHGLATLGLVTVVMQATGVVSALLASVAGRMGLPVFAALQGAPERMKAAFHTATEALMFVAAPVFLGLLVTAGDWVPLILGEKWIATVPLIQILCVARLLSLSRSFAGPYITALGHPRSLLGPAVAGVSITIVALLFTRGLAPEFVVYAWTTRLLVTIPTSFYLLSLYARVSLGFQLRPLVGPLVAAAVMVGSVLLWRSQVDLTGWTFLVSEQFWRLGAEIAVGVVVFSASAALIYRQHIGKILGKPIGVPRDPA